MLNNFKLQKVIILISGERMIISRAPTRISFAGGGTDIESYFNQYGGCVVSTTITPSIITTVERISNNIVKVDLNYKNGIESEKNLDLINCIIKNFENVKGININVVSEVPQKSGLGGSSSAAVSLIGAFYRLIGKKIDKKEIAKLAYEIERFKLGIKGGYQDQYASAFGGLNFIEFSKNEIKVNPLKIKKSYLEELEKNLILIHILKRVDNIVHTKIENYIKRKETDKIEALNKTKELAIEIKDALEKGDLNHFGELLGKAWEQKKISHPNISTPYINELYDLAKKHGAIGGKLCGAGGFMFLYCQPDRKEFVLKELSNFGAVPMEFKFDNKGLVVLGDLD